MQVRSGIDPNLMTVVALRALLSKCGVKTDGVNRAKLVAAGGLLNLW